MSEEDALTATRIVEQLARVAYEQAMLDDGALPEGHDSWGCQPEEVKQRWMNVVIAVLQENRR